MSGNKIETPEEMYKNRINTVACCAPNEYLKLLNHYRDQVNVLREALEALGLAQSRMLNKWADGDQAVKDRLWRDLHSKEDQWRDALENHNKWIV